MKKEKKVRTYQRRTKTGKLVTVKQHTAKYDAAEKAKEMLKKKGAGDELSAKKKAKPASSAGELDFSQADFKAWYHWDQENDPKNPAALKVEKALKAKMGAKAYRKYFNDMSDSYSARGHIKAYKECSSCGDKADIKNKEAKAVKVKETKISKQEAPKEKSVGLKAVDTKLARRVMKEEDFDSLREAKSYLADMPKSSYDRYVKLYAERDAKEKSKVGSVEGIAKYTSSKAGKTGFTRLMGSQASSAKKTLLENGYTEVRGVPEYRPDGTKRGTFTGLIGPNGEAYLYRGGGMSPALLVKADKSKKKDILEWHKTKTSPKSLEKTNKATPKSSKELREELKAAERREYNATVKKHRDTTKAALDKAGVSKEDVIAYMRGMQGGRRKWTWHGSEGVFKTNRMADGRPMKGYDTKTMAQAIKQMQKAQGKTDSPKSSEKPAKASRTEEYAYGKYYGMSNQKKAEKAGVPKKDYEQYVKLVTTMERAHDSGSEKKDAAAKKKLGSYLRSLPKEHRRALETEQNIRFYEKGGW